MKILVLDDHPLMVVATVNMLQGLFDAAEVKGHTSAQEVLSQKEEGGYDLIFSDLLMPDIEPEALVEALTNHYPTAKKIFMSAMDMREPLPLKIISEGMLFVEKNQTFRDMVEMLMAYVKPSARVNTEPANCYQTTIQVPGKKALTHKQAQVMDGLAEGLTLKEIARNMDLSPDTVKAHVKEAYARMGADNRAQAVLAYQQAKALSTVMSQ